MADEHTDAGSGELVANSAPTEGVSVSVEPGKPRKRIGAALGRLRKWVSPVLSVAAISSAIALWQKAEDAQRLRVDRDKLSVERDKLSAERDKLGTEQTKLSAEQSKLIAERDKFMLETERLRRERDEAAGRELQIWLDNLNKRKTKQDQIAILEMCEKMCLGPAVQQWAREQHARIDKGEKVQSVLPPPEPPEVRAPPVREPHRARCDVYASPSAFSPNANGEEPQAYKDSAARERARIACGKQPGEARSWNIYNDSLAWKCACR